MLRALVLVACFAGSSGANTLRRNILYLITDDARTQSGTYGQLYMKTPNLDHLANESLQFTHAYCQFSYCSPSRNSFLTGRRPDRTRTWNFLAGFRENAVNGKSWETLPQFFKNQGYFTSAAGKVFHINQDPDSWSHPYMQWPKVKCGEGDEMDPLGNYCGITNTSKIQYDDEDQNLNESLARMELAVKSGKPFFLAHGTHKPHHPWRLPDGFWGTQLYPKGPGDMVLPPKHPDAPADEPWMAGNYMSGDINDNKGNPSCTIPAENVIEYRRWYYAAISYVDHIFGVLLQKLKDLGVDKDTIVVYHSDHGYNLGELNEWSKKTNTELAVRTPLTIKVPWKPASKGVRSAVKAELVDLYRTLADLTGNTAAVQDDVQGMSLAPLFDKPSSPSAALRDKPAFSQMPRCACQVYYKCRNCTFPREGVKECNANACHSTPTSEFDFMGYTMRTGDGKYRVTAWYTWNKTSNSVNWNELAGQELYDSSGDDGSSFDVDGYSFNLAGKPEYNVTVQELLQKLREAVGTWPALPFVGTLVV